MDQVVHDFTHQFRYPKPKRNTPSSTTSRSAENQRRLRIRREIEWRQECKAAELDIASF
ncbi:hypothetical protein [Shewanella colwelliana]|uniref:hypothetical protein n=1 Tax=Shewanella colwelliana TaxID=23 RepID=UPI00373565EA